MKVSKLEGTIQAKIFDKKGTTILQNKENSDPNSTGGMKITCRIIPTNTLPIQGMEVFSASVQESLED